MPGMADQADHGMEHEYDEGGLEPEEHLEEVGAEAPAAAAAGGNHAPALANPAPAPVNPAPGAGNPGPVAPALPPPPVFQAMLFQLTLHVALLACGMNMVGHWEGPMLLLAAPLLVQEGMRTYQEQMEALCDALEAVRLDLKANLRYDGKNAMCVRARDIIRAARNGATFCIHCGVHGEDGPHHSHECRQALRTLHVFTQAASSVEAYRHNRSINLIRACLNQMPWLYPTAGPMVNSRKRPFQGRGG